MKDRLNKILEESGLKKVKFAEKINVHQSYITKMISGEKTPSERLIDDICEKIIIDGRQINKDWLLTGNGEMYRSRTRNQEIYAFATDLMEDVDESFRKRFVKALSKLDERDWKAIEKIVDELKKED